jgi:ribonucleoside-diphosphate reductase alpha chain
MATTYTYQQVYEACLKYFKGNELAATAVATKYVLQDNAGNFLELCPEDYIRNRIAPEFARIEATYPNPTPVADIQEAMQDFRYILCQGSPTFGIGNKYQIVSLANCFVIGQPTDSYGGIMQKDEQMAQIMKRRGGVGIDISSLRPSGTSVRNSARSSDGIPVFMRRYSNTTKEVAQGGRRGALMIGLHCNHPDVEHFITIKRDETQVTGANLSVKWTDEFLRAVEKDEEVTLRFPVDADPKDAMNTHKVKARAIWGTFVQSAWASGEPGCIFWDRVTGQSISDCYADVGFATVISNPCGEIFMSEYNSCILMVLNLVNFVDQPFAKGASMNWERFDKYVRMALRLTDDLIDLELEKIAAIVAKIESDPEPEEVKATELRLWKRVQDCYLRGRRVGLGVTGLADLLAMMGYKYDSDQSLQFAERLFSTLQTTVYDEDAELAKERGPFPVWDWEKEKDCHYITQLPKEVQAKIKKHGRRNIACLTISPSGTTSLLSETSSGIEPVIQLVYRRNKKMTPEEEGSGIKPDYIDKDGIKWVGFDVVHPKLAQWTQVTGETDFKKSPYWGCDINGADWRFRVRLQALAQRYIDQSISSTVNLPNSATVEDVNEVYMLAWKEGCKGVTLFRDGCRRGVIQSQKSQETTSQKREPVLPCDIHYSNIFNRKTGKTEQWIFLVGVQKGTVYEVFGGKKTLVDLPKRYAQGWIAKNGKNDKGFSTYNLILGSLDEESPDRMVIEDIAMVFTPEPGSFTRLVSLSLRNKVPLRLICEQLLKDQDASMFSFEKGLARVLRKYIKEGEKSSDQCPKCGNKTLEYRSGCVYCVTPNCGWSRCD